MDAVIITCHRLDAYETAYTVLADLRPELTHQERVDVADAIVRRLATTVGGYSAVYEPRMVAAYGA